MNSKQNFVQPDECSKLGLLILEHMKKHKLSPQEMAQELQCSQAALRICCCRQGIPGTRMISKLASVLGQSESEINKLAYENKVNKKLKLSS